MLDRRDAHARESAPQVLLDEFPVFLYHQAVPKPGIRIELLGGVPGDRH